MPSGSRIIVHGGGGLQPGYDMYDGGLVSRFFGVPDNFGRSADYPIVTQGFASTPDGTLPPASNYLDPSWVSGWTQWELPFYSHNYTQPPVNTTFLTGRDVATGSGPGGIDLAKWVVRDTIPFPSDSATEVTTPGGLTWDGANYTAGLGEQLYLLEFWADNSGAFYIDDGAGSVTSVASIDGSEGSGDYKATFVISAKPGMRFYCATEAGDGSFDGLGVRLSQFHGVGGHWVTGSIAIGDY